MKHRIQVYSLKEANDKIKELKSQGIKATRHVGEKPPKNGWAKSIYYVTYDD